MAAAPREQLDHFDKLRRQWARELPGLDTSPMALLGRINRVAALIHPSIAAVLAEFEIDRGEFDVLAALRRSGRPYRLTPTELYTSLLISSGGLTSRLARLERAGLVSRKPASDDGRSLLVQLTAEGARRVQAAFRADMANEQKLLGKLDDKERETLARLLKKLLLGLETQDAA